jgi:phosphoribosyl-ATP pyrophosphohydrolase
MDNEEVLARLAAVIESRKLSKGGLAESSYVAKLFERGSEGILKKVGEEAVELVMAAKDLDHGGARRRVIEETADLWFHTLVVLAHYDLSPDQVLDELQRREGIGGLQEKAMREGHKS